MIANERRTEAIQRSVQDDKGNRTVRERRGEGIALNPWRRGVLCK